MLSGRCSSPYIYQLDANRTGNRLATMIVRCGVELDKLIETIHTSGFLGECDMEELASFKAEHPNLVVTQNMREREGTLGQDGSVDPVKNHFWFLAAAWTERGGRGDVRLEASRMQESVQRDRGSFLRDGGHSSGEGLAGFRRFLKCCLIQINSIDCIEPRKQNRRRIGLCTHALQDYIYLR